MTNINNINGIGVGLNTNMPQKESAPETQEQVLKEVPQQKAGLENLMSQDDVMNVLAQQAAINKSTIASVKAYDVAKYVTPEQAQRIAGFVTSFEDIVAQNLDAVTLEFGNTLSDDAKMNIVLSSADKMVV